MLRYTKILIIHSLSNYAHLDLQIVYLTNNLFKFLIYEDALLSAASRSILCVVIY